MKYPMTNNWLSYRRISDYEYEVTDNLDDSVYTMGCTIAKFAKQLDGHTNPYEVDRFLPKEDVRSMLTELNKNDLLRSSRVLESSFGSFLYTIWIPQWTPFLRIFAFLMNNMLILLWLPSLVFGIYVFIKNILVIDVEISLTGYLLGLLGGICAHELAHAFAGISYRAKVFEFGIGVQNFMPCAYTLLENSNCKRQQRIQINAAGVEANLFIAGVCLLLCAALPRFSPHFYSAAIMNANLGVLNLLCLGGLDGMAILTDVIGTDVGLFLENATRIVCSKRIRAKLQKKGLWGHALILTSYIMIFSQIGFPLLLLLNIGGIISCFI